MLKTPITIEPCYYATLKTPITMEPCYYVMLDNAMAMERCYDIRYEKRDGHKGDAFEHHIMIS